MTVFKNKIIKKILLALGCLLIIFIAWQGLKKVPMEGDWQEQLKVISTAEFKGDLVTVKNVRNFRYSPTEKDMHPHQDAKKRGYTRMIYALMREGNSIKNFPKEEAVIFRHYTAFEFQI